MLCFWLANTHALLCDMKAFSGEPQFQVSAEPLPYVLAHFDLTDYREIVADLLLHVFQTVVKHAEHPLLPLIVPALLEAEPLVGMADPAEPASPPRKGSNRATIAAVTDWLQHVCGQLRRVGADPRLAKQVVAQLLHLINATVVNSLLLRKDLCHWSKGMQVGARGGGGAAGRGPGHSRARARSATTWSSWRSGCTGWALTTSSTCCKSRSSARSCCRWVGPGGRGRPAAVVG